MGQYLAPYLADHSWSGPPFVAGSLRAGEVNDWSECGPLRAKICLGYLRSDFHVY